MKLYLISDTANPHKEFREHLFSTLSSLNTPIAYISSSTQTADRPWFNSKIKDLQNVNADVKMEYFDLSEFIYQVEIPSIF
jgi:hypothetical protein